jgi:hypothetical protein
VLVEGLSPDARTSRLIGDVDERLQSWSLSTALLGRLVDEIAALRWEYEAVHVEQRDRREPPTSVLPSSEREADVVLLSPRDLGDFMSDFEGE